MIAIVNKEEFDWPFNGEKGDVFYYEFEKECEDCSWKYVRKDLDDILHSVIKTGWRKILPRLISQLTDYYKKRKIIKIYCLDTIVG